MGALTSRQHAGVEEVDIPSNSVYRYPPKSGEGGRAPPGLGRGRGVPAPGSRGSWGPRGPPSLRSDLGGRTSRRGVQGCLRGLGGVAAAATQSAPGRERPARSSSCDRRVPCAGALRLPRGRVPGAGPFPSRPGPSLPGELRAGPGCLGIPTRHPCQVLTLVGASWLLERDRHGFEFGFSGQSFHCLLEDGGRRGVGRAGAFQAAVRGEKKCLTEMFGNREYQSHPGCPFARVAASLSFGIGVGLGRGTGI